MYVPTLGTHIDDPSLVFLLDMNLSIWENTVNVGVSLQGMLVSSLSSSISYLP